MKKQRSRFPSSLLVVLAWLPGLPLEARVHRIEILERTSFAGGVEFGSVGPYERIRGRLHYAVDPGNPHNTQIVDLALALEGRLRRDLSRIEGDRIVEIIGDDAVNQQGEVEFSGDFLLLKPVDLSRGNHRLLYGVNNRGTQLMLGFHNDARSSTDPVTLQDAGNGWLMRQGYTLLWSGWNWDVDKVGQNPLRINLPVVVEADGSPMTGKVAAELAVQDRDGVPAEWLAAGGSRCYAVAGGAEQEAVLTVRETPEGQRKVIPRADWRFALIDEDGKVQPDRRHVHLPSGFLKGQLYELIYTAVHPRVVGLGLAAIRDAISFFRFDPQDGEGNPNPLAVEGGPDARFAYIFGISQSGRVIIHMIHQGFHVDEQCRMVFEGARPHVAGGGKGGFNFRWAQTTHHQKHLEGNFYPADFFPFNFTENGVEQFDPLGQEGRKHGDLLAQAKQFGRIPRILICNHGVEYWTRSASLIHTDVTGTSDVSLHPNVRVYMINGARHGTPGGRRTDPDAEHSVGQLDQRPVGRALLVALDEWVTYGIGPPENRVPSIASGELITAEEHARRFPRIPRYELNGILFPASRHLGRGLRPPRVDFGPRFWLEGVQDYLPPKLFGPPYRTLVPAFDRDGNGIGGIRLPELAVPLGTYQAFNPRRPETGSPDFLTPFSSSFWPFVRTLSERLARNDPRLSIEERYAGKDDYVERVKRATLELEQQRLLLEEDGLRIVRLAERLVWPPVPSEGPPYWLMEPAAKTQNLEPRTQE